MNEKESMDIVRKRERELLDESLNDHEKEEKGWTGFTKTDLSLALDYSDKIHHELENLGFEFVGSGCGFGVRDMEFECNGMSIFFHIKVKEEEEEE